MAAFIIYAIRWAVTLTLLYSLFRILLRRETFHRLNRTVLLAILLVSPLLPLIPLHTDEPTAMDMVLTRIEGPLVSLSSDTDDAGSTLSVPKDEKAASDLWVCYSTYIFIFGIAVALATYLFRLLTLLRVIRRSHRIYHPIVPNNVHLMLNMKITQPSSWMNWIFIGPIDLKRNAEPVLKHELAHVRMRHSWDVIFCDLTCSLLWCLPFAWMLRKDLVDVHEFQADEAVLQGGVTLDEYEQMLVLKAVQKHVQPIMNTLRRGALKKRFAMMHRSRSSRLSRLKLLYLLPAFAACLWVSAQAEEYKAYLNGKFTTQEKLEAEEEKRADNIQPKTMKAVPEGEMQQREPEAEATEENDSSGEPKMVNKPQGVDPAPSPSKAIDSSIIGHEAEQMPQFPGGEEAGHQYDFPVNDDVFNIAEEMPEFVGGEVALSEYISRHLPSKIMGYGIQGRMDVSFVVERDGSITNVTATLRNETGSGADANITGFHRGDKIQPNGELVSQIMAAWKSSAEQLVRDMPSWKPARQNGHVVRARVLLPIRYRQQ